MKEYLLDTTVLIDYFRGSADAGVFLDTLHTPATSILCIGELYQGARNKHELEAIKKFVKNHMKVLPLSEEIGAISLRLLEKYTKSHNLLIIDSLIAATAISRGLTLISANTTHFTGINELTFESSSW
jgi:predicted nucleic acid-binding protein